MLASTVSSKMISQIANKEGFEFHETLTGFKWLGNKAIELEKQGKTVAFAFEEAIGYMLGSVRDKDGVSALAVFCELALYLKKQGKSVKQFLESVYEEYGYSVTLNSYVISRDTKKTDAMFEAFRRVDGQGAPAYVDAIGGVKIVGIRDLTIGYDSTRPDKKPILPVSKSSHMITLTYDFSLPL